MADFSVNDVASLGVIKDIPGFQLPPEAWTIGENVRIVSDGVARMPGWAQAFSSLSLTGSPFFAVQLHTSAGAIWWLYGTATDLYVINDSAAEFNVSQAGGYTATYWQETFLGGVPILNNGSDKPQFWASYDTGTDFADLTNWPATETCPIIRAFGPYLVALRPTIGGTTFPHMVHWSHPADPGSVPSSWDETDPTKDAGKNDLADTESGGIVDGLPLRSSLVIYKEHSTWLMRPVGGQFIFQFDQFLTRSGLLSRDCMALTGDGAYHFVVSEDDIIIHDTVNAQSVLNKRMRDYLFNQIEDSARGKCYVFANPREKEMWFCYPETGSSAVNRAFIWNYGAGGQLGTCYEADYPFPYTALGDIDVTSIAPWSSAAGTWADFFGSWNSSDRRRAVGVDTGNKKLFLHDSSLTRDGAAFTARVTREGLAVIGRRRDGTPIVDLKTRKLIRKLWPKVIGGPINIKVGSQETLYSSTTWDSPKAFDPSTDRFIDVAVSGAALSVDFSTEASVDWKLYGYDMEITPAGRY